MRSGQQLVDRIEAWLSSWAFFPADYYALVCTLWALNTWVFDQFDAVPYLAVTAATKRAGKTMLLELIALVSYNPEMAGSASPAAVYRVMAANGGRCSLFFDEA